MKKIIVTLGPSTNTLEKLFMIKNKGVDFVRINMSHSTLEDLQYYIDLSKKASIPFIIDTEGSQVRTKSLSSKSIYYNENDIIRLYEKEIIGNEKQISLSPGQIVKQLEEGDILYVDFDTLALRVLNTETIKDGYVEATIISSGNLGENKGVTIDPRVKRKFDIPNLSEKDVNSIKLGLKENIGYVAASFMRNIEAVKEVRKVSENKMKIISKIECVEALENLDDIIMESDYLLIDRGDLSKEIPIEKIPFTQKIILQRAKNVDRKVFVATNLLESMIQNRKPTRAEVHDIINTIVDGAYGLTLAAETAIGKHPIGCINMLNKIINHSDLVINAAEIRNKEKKFVQYLEEKNYLLDEEISLSVVKPNGGKLVDRIYEGKIDINYFNSLQKIKLNANQQLDIEQIAIGTYSPLEGFMKKSELESVLNSLRLPGGTIWPLPILLDIDKEKSKKINEGDEVALFSENNELLGSIKISEKYSFDKKIIAEKLFQSSDSNHPGINILNSLKPIFIGGKISLFKKIKRDYDKYHLTPKQTRRLFEEKNWEKVVGFHTRNVIHLAHEFIQLSALEKGRCDGLFIQPVVGTKKIGDYNSRFIIKSYEIMQKKFYPQNKTVFGVFSTYSRYAGDREALFTALCRQNYGCSHFVVGRDHTGIGQNRDNSIDIFSQFPDFGMQIIKYNTVYYSKKNKTYIEEDEKLNVPNNDKLSISGSEARRMFNTEKMPPDWYMRPEISKMVIKSIKEKEDVFVL
tara:strand:+ start:604 stop:2841 length:2238 start_codon:yes stop_codon:yes gene_type:complete